MTVLMMCAQIDSRWARVTAMILLVAGGAYSLLEEADRDVYPVFEFKRIKCVVAVISLVGLRRQIRLLICTNSIDPDEQQ